LQLVFTLKNNLFFAEISKELFISLLIALILAVMLDLLIHEASLNEIKNSLNRSKVLIGAAELNITNIYSRRKKGSERWSKSIKNAIKKQLSKKEGEILIQCVAAPDLLRIDSALDIGRIIFENLSDPKNKCKLKVLHLDPNSDWAKLRDKLETGHFPIQDIQQTISYLKHVQQFSNNNVDFRPYDCLPPIFIIMTDEIAFIEPYPVLETKIGKAPLGGKTPILSIKCCSEEYALWKEHFNYMWNNGMNLI
jgi:hypothetical protein